MPSKPNTKILFLDLDNTLTGGHTHAAMDRKGIQPKFKDGLVSNGKPITTVYNNKKIADLGGQNAGYDEIQSIASAREVLRAFGGLKNAGELGKTCALAHSDGYKICIVTANLYPDAVELVRDELVKETNKALANQGMESNTVIDYVSGFPTERVNESKNQQLETAARTLYGVDLRNPEQAANCTYIDDSKKFISSAEKEFPGIVSITAPAKGVPGTAYLLEAQQNIKETVERERVAELEEEPMYVNVGHTYEDLPGRAAKEEGTYENLPQTLQGKEFAQLLKNIGQITMPEQDEHAKGYPKKEELFGELPFQKRSEANTLGTGTDDKSTSVIKSLKDVIKDIGSQSKSGALKNEMKDIHKSIDPIEKKLTANPSSQTKLSGELGKDVRSAVEKIQKKQDNSKSSNQSDKTKYGFLDLSSKTMRKIVEYIDKIIDKLRGREPQSTREGAIKCNKTIEGPSRVNEQLDKIQTPSKGAPGNSKSHVDKLEQRRSSPHTPMTP